MFTLRRYHNDYTGAADAAKNFMTRLVISAGARPASRQTGGIIQVTAHLLSPAPQDIRRSDKNLIPLTAKLRVTY
jgi:hypothetical protein